MENNIIYGRNPLLEALKADTEIDTLYVQKGLTGLNHYISAAKEKGAVIKNVTEEKLRFMTGNSHHGGIAALVTAIPYVDIEEILAVSAEKGKPPFIIIAAEIEDPHNLGAIIRTAEAAGADGVIIPKRRSAGLSGATQNASAGAVNWIKVARVANLVDTVKILKKHNIWIYGAEADGEPYTKVNFSGGAALVIGSEGHGLGRLLRENCDKIVSIDMYGKINSLNASVSAGILMYEVVKARNI